MSTRYGPRNGAQPNTNKLNTVPERIEPSILQYVHPGQKKSSHESRIGSGRYSSSKSDKKWQKSRQGRKSKRDNRINATPTEVHLDQFENSSVPRLWSTTGVMNTGKTQTVFPPSPVMPRFRSVIHTGDNTLSSAPLAGSHTLPLSTAPAAFGEELPPLRGSPRVVSVSQGGQEKKKRSKKSSKRRDRSSNEEEHEC